MTKICDTCETVKHCTQHGCIPAHPSPIARPLTAALMRDDGGEQPAFCVMAAFRQEGDAQALLDMLAKPRADQALVPGAHPKPAAPIMHLNGYQLSEALDFIAPDGTPEQLECEVSIQYGPERVDEEGTDPAGLFCWVSDYPEEGSIRLDEGPAPQAPAPEAHQHPDDAAVDRFAAAMKAKLAAARTEGRSGWNDPAQCTADDLAIDLRKHVNKGDPVDVANVAMFLHARGESTKLRPLSGDLIDAIKAAPAGTSAIEHGGAVVFVSREGDHSAPTLLLGEMNHRELNAEVTEVNYYSGQIILQVTGGREVPKDLAAGAEVDILYQAAQDGEQEGSAA